MRVSTRGKEVILVLKTVDSASDAEAGLNPTQPIRVSLLSEKEFGRWDRFVAESPQANPFAAVAWCKAVSEVLDFGYHIWVVSKGDEWLGGIPVFWRRRHGRFVCVQPPLCAYSSILYSPIISRASYPSKVTFYFLEVTKYLEGTLSTRYSSSRLKLLPSIADTRAFQWTGWNVTPNYTYIIDLTRDLQCSHSVRKHIRKCREGNAVLSLEWQFNQFCALAEDTATRQGQGFGGITFPSLDQLASRMRDAGLAWMATALSSDGQPLASRIQLAIPGSSTAYDWVAGSSSAHFSLGGSPWLMIKIAESAKLRGYSNWDLCGANYENIAQFKSQFGGELVHGWVLTGPSSNPGRFYRAASQAKTLIRSLLVKQ
jgi:hypothetical protein